MTVLTNSSAQPLGLLQCRKVRARYQIRHAGVTLFVAFFFLNNDLSLLLSGQPSPAGTTLGAPRPGGGVGVPGRRTGTADRTPGERPGTLLHCIDERRPACHMVLQPVPR